jgi:ferric iron reductase protein FhuF
MVTADEPRANTSKDESLLTALRSALGEAFASYCDGLTDVDADMMVGLGDLLTPARTTAILDRFNKRFGRTDSRAVLSIWTAWHFIAVLPPLIASNVLLDRDLAIQAADVRFVLSEDLRANALAIDGTSEDVDSAGYERRFRPLIENYLEPFIAYVAARSGTSQRVLWSNAGSTFDSVLRKFDGLMRGSPGHMDAVTLLTRERWEDGARNPLFEPVQEKNGKRFRKVCCMRFLVPDGRLCGTCPLDRSRFPDKATGPRA